MKADDLKKLDTLIKPEGGEEEVAISTEHLLMSLAISAKRIADALEDGLIHLSDDQKVLGLADIIAKNREGIINHVQG
jgi:hypothetical protein